MRLACRFPATVGVNTTVAMQLEPAASVVSQVLLAMEKSPVLAPEIAMSRMVIADEPPLVSFTCCNVPAEPTGTASHTTLVGFTKTATTEMQPVNCREHSAKSAAKRIVPVCFAALI
jgi:hypothetical protein